MKRLININAIALAIICVLISSCCNKKHSINDRTKIKKPERVKVLSSTSINGYYTVSIVEIDGHIYTTQAQGGLTHLESCNCKKH